MLLESAFIALGVYTLVFQLPQLIVQTRLSRAVLRNPWEAEPLIKKELERTHSGRHREILKLLMAECLFLQGDFPMALHYARSTDAREFQKAVGLRSPLYQMIYCNGMLYYLVLGGAYQEAHALLPEFQNLLRYAGANAQLVAACWDTLGTYHYYFGDLESASRAFQKSLGERVRSKQGIAMSNYFLGRIELAQGRVDSGLAKLARSAELLPNSFLAEEPRRLAEGNERIPPPGAAQKASS